MSTQNQWPCLLASPPHFFLQMCLLNPNISIKKDGQYDFPNNDNNNNNSLFFLYMSIRNKWPYLVASLFLLVFPPSACVLLTQTYKLKCMDNMIFLMILLIILFLCVYTELLIKMYVQYEFPNMNNFNFFIYTEQVFPPWGGGKQYTTRTSHGAMRYFMVRPQEFSP